MIYRNFLTSAACVGLVVSALSASPAAAAIDPVYGTDPDLDELCSDAQRANANSSFVSFADDIRYEAPEVISEEVGATPISIVGIGTPDTIYGNFSGARVNGHSPNIHADAETTLRYPGGAVATYKTTITTKVTRSAGCHVHKPTQGANQEEIHPGYQIAPPGQQTADRVSTFELVVTHGTKTVNIPGPWTDPNASGTSQVVICISPGSAPGNWRNQNGYDGSLGVCSRDWYDTLGSTPSESLPD